MVLDAELKGAFDNISHDYILKAIGEIPGRELIKQWLLGGYVEAEILKATESGVPKGGVISPVLANIALDGIEQLLASHTKTKVYQTATHQTRKYGFICYNACPCQCDLKDKLCFVGLKLKPIEEWHLVKWLHSQY